MHYIQILQLKSHFLVCCKIHCGELIHTPARRGEKKTSDKAEFSFSEIKTSQTQGGQYETQNNQPEYCDQSTEEQPYMYN